MKTLPRDPGPRAGLFEQIDFLQAMAAFLGDAAVALLKGHKDIMATVAELQSALDANTAATAAAGVAISSEITALAAAIAALTPGEAVTQAQLDQLNAATTALSDATAALAADDAPAP
jgi:hypothetical protein